MMFYDNDINLKNVSYQRKKYASFSNGVNSDYDENLLPIKYSPLTYNFNFNDGSLRDGIGMSNPIFRYSENFPEMTKAIKWPESEVITGCWLYRFWDKDLGDDRAFLIAYTVSGNFYYNNLKDSSSDMIQIEGLNFKEKPRVLTYNIDGVDTLILVSKNDGMYTWVYRQDPIKVDNVPLIKSMCVHYERLFVTTFGDNRSVWFSDNLNPTNFNIGSRDGGFIELNDEYGGDSNKVISFDGYLYIFRDFNIARVSAFGDQQDFSVTQLYLSNGRIYDKTVSLCGNRVMYLASDGIYSFNGSNSTKINLSIDKLFDGVDNDYAVGAYNEGCYYLICKLNYPGDKVMHETQNQRMYNNTLIRINVNTGEMSILRGYNFVDLFLIKYHLNSEVMVSVLDMGLSRVLVVDNSGKYIDEPTPKVWNSPMSDFGYPDKYKLIREIVVETSADIIIEIVADNQSYSYRLKGKNGYQSIRPYVKGKKIAVNFISNTIGNKISNPNIVVGYL